MPIGLIFMRWDELTGNEILAKFPQEIDIPNKTLMQISHTHEFGGEIGMISLMVGTANIASYYTGPETNYCIVIILNLGEDPDNYEHSLAEVSQIILQNLVDKGYEKLIPSLYQQICDFPDLNQEQRLITTYQNEIKRAIINHLRHEGIISKSELRSWLKQDFPQSYGDLNLTLFEFVQKEIIQILSVKSERSVVLFYTNDIVILRIPPFKILKNLNKIGLPEDIKEKYLEKINGYFNGYHQSEEDNLNMINTLNNPQTYKIFDFLREEPLTKSNFEKLRKNGVESIDSGLKALKDAQMVEIFKDPEGNEIHVLITDLFIDLIIPEYILNTIKNKFEQKIKSNEVLIKYLNLLETQYLNME